MLAFQPITAPIPEMAPRECGGDLSMATSAVQAVLQSTRSTAMRDFEFRDGKMRTLTCEFANTARRSGQYRKANVFRDHLFRQCAGLHTQAVGGIACPVDSVPAAPDWLLCPGRIPPDLFIKYNCKVIPAPRFARSLAHYAARRDSAGTTTIKDVK